jgi:hypothetical protein
LVVYWYGPALCTGRSRPIWHIVDGKRASGGYHVTLSTGRPLPAYSRRLVSLQAECSLCHSYGMHASRRQQQACLWNRATGTPPPLVRACVTMVIVQSDRGCSPRTASNGRNAPGRMPATKGPAWYPTAHSCATSDTNASLHPDSYSM